MAISTAVSRFTDYYRRKGFGATLRRAGVAVKRSLFSSRSVLFYCDLATQGASPKELPGFLKVERKRSIAELNDADLQEMTSFWNPKLARQNMEERFGLGASLWLIKSRDKLAGYGWTYRGGPSSPITSPWGRMMCSFSIFTYFPNSAAGQWIGF